MLNKFKYNNKIIISLILSIFILIGFTNYSNAASFSITSGISTITVGESYTIKITATGLTGRFNITHSSNVSVNVDSVWIENGTAESTIKVTTIKEGTATVTIAPDAEFGVSDSNGLVSLSSKTDTVNVKAKTSSSSSSSSSSSGSNSTTTPTSTTTPKPTFTSKNETVYATSQVNVRTSYSTSSSILGTLNAGDSVTRTGIASSSVNGILWSKVTYNGQTAYISSDFLTTTKPQEEEKSNNKNLKSLTVIPTGLSPEFSSDITEYTMTVGSDIDEIEIDAVVEDEKAKAVVSGNTALKTGSNVITIKVTAEDETVRNYKITVTKEDKEQLKLKELLVEGLPLEPEFDGNTYEYTVALDRSDVTEVNITATPNRDDAEVEIVGNTELKVGENLVTILVRSDDEEEIIIYQISINVPEATNIALANNQELYKYVGVAVIGVILVIIIIVAIIKHRKKYDDFSDYYEDYNSEINNEKDVNEDIDKTKNEVDDLLSTIDDDDSNVKSKRGKHF